MAGRPRRIRSIQSYVNHIDTHSGLGTLKEGFPPRVGVTRRFWQDYRIESTPGPLSFNTNPKYYATKVWKTYDIGHLHPNFKRRPF